MRLACFAAFISGRQLYVQGVAWQTSWDEGREEGRKSRKEERKKDSGRQGRGGEGKRKEARRREGRKLGQGRAAKGRAGKGREANQKVKDPLKNGDTIPPYLGVPFSLGDPHLKKRGCQPKVQQCTPMPPNGLVGAMCLWRFPYPPSNQSNTSNPRKVKVKLGCQQSHLCKQKTMFGVSTWMNRSCAKSIYVELADSQQGTKE